MQYLKYQAHKPEKILSARIYDNETFDRMITRFTRRFRNDTFGYTLFGFLTFKKQTVLSVSNPTLMACAIREDDNRKTS